MLVQHEQDVDELEVEDPERVAYITQTTLSVDETAAILARLRERFPSIVGPRTDDICYATTNRQAAVKQMAGSCDLVLVIGSRNSSNSVRLVEVARDCGTDAHLIDNASEVREEWLTGKRVVGISSGASAPDELVRSCSTSSARGASQDISEFHVVREDVRFMLPKPIRERSSPAGRRRSVSRRLRTLIVSDLHLGSASGVGRAAPSRAARGAAGGAGRRRSPRAARRRARAAPRPAARRAGRRAAVLRRPRRRRSPAARSWCSPATTTTRWSSRGSAQRALQAPRAARPRAAPARRRRPRRCSRSSPSGPRRRSVTVAYPGLWVRPDVYATHGHYLDCHLTVPTIERLSIGAMGRVLRRPAASFSRARGLRGGRRPRCSPGSTRRPGRPHRRRARTGRHGARVAGARRVTAMARLSRARRTLRGLALAGAFPLAVAALNRAGLGPLRTDISTEELRRAGLRAMGEVAARLGLGDALRRLRPHPPRRTAARRRRVASGAAPAARGWSTRGCWTYDLVLPRPRAPARAPTGREAACSSRTTAPPVLAPAAGPLPRRAGAGRGRQPYAKPGVKQVARHCTPGPISSSSTPVGVALVLDQRSTRPGG